MPRFDGTGPMGASPMTGRGMGPCGFGWRNQICCPCFGRGMRVSDEQKTEYLQGEAEALREELKAVEGELGKLKK
ncbi:MAG: DUF5320 domain-containing protein [bacterium]